MDATERRRLLFEKINANHQRLKREELLNRLPPHISRVLGDSRCIYSVEIDPILRQFYPFSQSGIGTSSSPPLGYKYAEVSSVPKLFHLLSHPVVPPTTEKAFFLLQPPSGVQFEGRGYYMPDTPLFEVDFQWAAPLLKELWSYCRDGLLLVEHNLRAGVLIDNYIGYLPDWNPREIIYQFAMWPAPPDEPVG